MLIAENKSDISRMKDDKMKSHLMIHGTPEHIENNPKSIITDLFTDLGLPFGTEATHAIYRVGAKPTGEHKDLKSICVHAKQNHVDARVSGNALVIEGRCYSHQDLGKLPHGLSLEKAKTITCKDGIAFQGPGSYLTNFYPVKLEHGEKIFSSVEQAFVYEKAAICNDIGAAVHVMTINNPYEVKAFA